MSETEPQNHVVIVGASLAGTRAAQALRTLGHTGAITLLGAETELPYDRPPLSKDLLVSDWSEAAVEGNRLLPAQDLADLHLDLRLGATATGLDTASNEVTLENGTRVHYDTLIIATGASARPSPWRPESGVLQLRTLADSRAIADALTLRQPVVVVGGGFIGTEIAAAAIRFGCPVTVVDPVPEPMTRLVGPEIAASLVELHRANGADTRFGVGVTDIRGEAGNLTVVLDDGTELAASTAIVGIGSVPNTGWLATSGLTLENGVVTDAGLRALGASNIYAIGDVARWPHPSLGLHRAEHWTNASDQARFVAAAIVGAAGGAGGVGGTGSAGGAGGVLGARAEYSSTDYVWSDQYNWKVHTVGHRDPAGTSVVVGNLQEDGRTAVIHADAEGNAVGAVTVNWIRALNQIRRLLAAGGTAESIAAQLAVPAPSAA